MKREVSREEKMAVETPSKRARKVLLSCIAAARGQKEGSNERPPDSFEGSARQFARGWLAALSDLPSKPTPTPQFVDIENLNKAVAAIMQASEENIITQDEADAVIEFIAQRFVERRFDDSLRMIVTPKMSKWFLVASHHQSGQYTHERSSGR